MVGSLRKVFLIFALALGAANCFGQACPSGFTPWQNTRDNSDRVHNVMCVNPATGAISVGFTGLNKTVYVDPTATGDAGVLLQACINAAIPGGTCDASTLTGSQTAAATVTIAGSMTLVFGRNVAITFSGNPGIALNANGITIRGPGDGSAILIQGVANQPIIWTPAAGAAFSGLTIRDLSFQGIGTGSGDQVGNNNDNAIQLDPTTRQNRVRILNNTFTQFLHESMWLMGISDLVVDNNVTFASIGCIRAHGIQNFAISNNVCRDSSETGTAPAAQTTIQLESTNGQPFGVSTDGTITGNVIKESGTAGYSTNTQAILLHGGQTISITGNTINNIYQGIALSPFNNTDLTSDVSISGNVLIGNTTAETGGSGPNVGILVSAITGNHAARVTVTGNTLTGWNRSQQNSAYGAIYLGFVDNLTVTSNTVSNSYGSCVAFANPVTVMKVDQLVCQNVTAAGGIRVGIYAPSGVTGLTGIWNDIQVDTADDVWRVGSANAGLLVGFSVGTNLASSAYVNPANVTFYPFTRKDLTAQGANIGATTLYAVPAGAFGLYRVSIYIIVTQAATTSSTMPAVTITWTDTDSGVAQSFAATATSAGNTTTTFAQAVVIVDANSSTNIQFSTSGYATSGATSMQYAIHLRSEPM